MTFWFVLKIEINYRVISRRILVSFSFGGFIEDYIFAW